MKKFRLKLWIKGIMRKIIKSVYYEYEPIVDILSKTFDVLCEQNFHVIEVRTEIGCYDGEVFAYAIMNKKFWKWPWQKLEFNAAE